MVAVRLDDLAHPVDRARPERPVAITLGDTRGDEALAAPRLDIGAIEPLQGVGDARRELGEVLHFLARQFDVAEQRVAEDLVELGEGAAVVAAGEVLQVDIEGFRQAQQHLRGDRPLVALDQIDIARRHAELGGDLGLRQPKLLAQPAESRAEKQFAPRLAAVVVDLCHFDKIT